jgi:predicted glycosyltransferase
MRILFEITHPKHVHFFRRVIERLKSRGHVVAITARDKDVTLDLLRAWGLEYTLLSARSRGGILALTWELLVRDWRLLGFVRQFKPDLLVARVGPSAAHVGKLLRRPVIVFEDTEDGTLQQRISFPFVTKICTANHYEKDWGAKHVRYQSFDEVAYLHPNQFTPDHKVVERAGLKPGEYIVVRFVSWKASHDIGKSGIDQHQRLWLLEELERYGRVVVTSEAQLSQDYERFRMSIDPADLHHVLAFARLSFGESATVTAEAALLGVPTVLVNTMSWGSINRLRDHYQLIFQTHSAEQGLKIASELLRNPKTPALWRQRREELLRQEIDLTDWMIREIENFGSARAVL